MRRLNICLAAALLCMPAAAMAQDRLPTIPPAQYDPDQRQAAADFLAARQAPVSGPFEPMMYSPDVMSRARAMGDYLRYKSRIGNTLSEFVILITARDWSQDYEWSIHAPIAAKAGIAPNVIAALHDRHRPESMTADEAILYEFTTELLRDKRVSDASFASVEKRWGKPGVADIVGLIGYYTFDAMFLNVAQYKAKDGTVLPRIPN